MILSGQLIVINYIRALLIPSVRIAEASTGPTQPVCGSQLDQGYRSPMERPDILALEVKEAGRVLCRKSLTCQGLGMYEAEFSSSDSLALVASHGTMLRKLDWAEFHSLTACQVGWNDDGHGHDVSCRVTALFSGKESSCWSSILKSQWQASLRQVDIKC